MILLIRQISVQFSSVTQSCPSLCHPMNRRMPGLPVHHQLPELPKPMSIESVMLSNHFILCHPLLLLPSSFPSIRVFSNGSALCIRWPKYWSFSFSISSSNEYSGLISLQSKSICFFTCLGAPLCTLYSFSNFYVRQAQNRADDKRSWCSGLHCPTYQLLRAQQMLLSP